ncbi:hypothetical protein HYU23_00060 [Candidatus Woesearchaeota archaeon]|nr:hypothetical protein [Candidatus Woesearchaeota archaeon]
MQSKKGAIELSITTIIVVVIGVTLLIFGLVFVRGVFEKVTTLTEDAFRAAEKEVQQRMGASDKIYVSGVNFEVESGKSTVFTVGVQNFGEETTVSKFKIDIVPGDTKIKKDEWFTLPPEDNLKPGDKKGFPVKVTLPKGAPPGKSYTFTIRVFKNNEEYASQAIIVSVKES